MQIRHLINTYLAVNEEQRVLRKRKKLEEAEQEEDKDTTDAPAKKGKNIGDGCF